MRLLPVFACALALAGCLHRQPAAPPPAPVVAAPPPSSGLTYVQQALSTETFVLEASRVALARAQSGDVKDFLEALATDHGASSKAIRDALAQAGVSPPAELDARHTRFLRELEAAPAGVAFDRLFVQQQLLVHQELVALDQAYAKSGANARLKAMADQLAPAEARHLATLRQLATAL